MRSISLCASLGLPKQPDNKKHFAALPYPDIPNFVGSLREKEAGLPAKLAFEFLVLTATRSGEVLGAKWDEINLEQQIWTVPANRRNA